MTSLNDSVVSTAATIRSNMNVMLNKFITLDDSMVYVDCNHWSDGPYY